MVSGVEGRGRMLEVWVRLGDELGEILEVFGVRFAVGSRRGNSGFWQKKRGEFGSLRLALALGLLIEEDGAFLGSPDDLSSVECYYSFRSTGAAANECSEGWWQEGCRCTGGKRRTLVRLGAEDVRRARTAGLG